jgi:hypothetical protein
VQTARATAIRQNLRTEFVLTDTPVETANLADNLVQSPNGQNWVVRVVDPTRAQPAFLLVESKVGQRELRHRGAVRSDRRRRRADRVHGIVPFNGFGSTADANNYTFLLQNLRGGACAPAGPMRCPTILVPAGGLARICDPWSRPPPTAVAADFP